MKKKIKEPGTEVEVVSGDKSSEKISNKEVWKRFFHTWKVADVPYGLFFLYIALNIAASNLMIKIPEVNADFFNGDGSVSSIVKFLVCEFAVTAISQVILFVNHIFRSKTNRNLRNVLWGKLLKIKPKYYDRVSSNTLISRLTEDTESFNSFLMDIIFALAFEVYYLFLTINEMSKISLKTSFYLLAFVPVFFVSSLVIGRLNARFENSAKYQMANLTDYLSELVSVLPIIKSFNRQSYEFRRGEKVINNYYGAKRNLIFLDVGKQFFSAVVGLVPDIAIILFGIRFLNDGTLDAAGWYVFYSYAGTLIVFASQLGSYWQNTKTIQGQLSTVSRVLLEEEEGIGHYIDEIEKSGDIGFDNVFFSYEEDADVLNGLSLTIKKNKTTAIVGPSGSGKSTILKFIEGLYEPDEGRVLCEGKSITDCDPEKWRRKIAFLSQQSPMIAGTIRENITYGIERELSDDEIMKAAKAAYVADFIEKCPDGLEHQVGQFGARLSGGQRQKISLARAILCNPEILVLDEPTASLDILSSKEIAATINDLHEKMTIIIVTHENIIAQDADEILVISEGRVAAQGNHRELLVTNEFYRRLAKGEKEAV